MKFVFLRKKKKKNPFLSNFKLEIILYRIFATIFQLLGRCLIFSRVQFVFLRTNISYTANSYAVVFSPLYSAAFIIVSFFSTQSTFYRSRISFVPFFLSLFLPPLFSVYSTLHSSIFSLSLSLRVPFLSFQPRPSSIQQLDSHAHRISIILYGRDIIKFIKFSQEMCNYMFCIYIGSVIIILNILYTFILYSSSVRIIIIYILLRDSKYGQAKLFWPHQVNKIMISIYRYI